MRSNDLCRPCDAAVSSRVNQLCNCGHESLRNDHYDLITPSKSPHLRLWLPFLFGFRSVRELLALEPRSSPWEIDFVFSFPFLFHASSERDFIVFAFAALLECLPAHGSKFQRGAPQRNEAPVRFR